MHATIITPYYLQGSMLIRSLKRQNINCSNYLPQNLTAGFSPNTDALIFPHPLSNQMWEHISGFLSNFYQHIPFIFIGDIHKSTIQKHFLNKYLTQSIFINDLIPNHKNPELIRDILLKKVKISNNTFAVGPLILDKNRRSLEFKGQKIILTKKEYFLLELLMTNVGQVTTRENIINHVWDKRDYVSPNTIDVYICRLRKKLNNTEKNNLIKTIPSLGYELITHS